MGESNKALVVGRALDGNTVVVGKGNMASVGVAGRELVDSTDRQGALGEVWCMARRDGSSQGADSSGTRLCLLS